MIRLQLLIGALMLGLLNMSCAYPAERVEQLDERPRIVVEGAPEGAHLLVDGIDAGSASGFSRDEAALRLLPGRHIVEIEKDGRSLFREEVFLGSSSLKVIHATGTEE